MLDMFGMLGKMGEIQKKMQEVKESLKLISLEESELGGVVKITITADRLVKKIETSDEFYNKYSKEEREEILVEAVNNAIQKAEARSKEEMSAKLQGHLPNIPGLDLANLPFGI
jgi:DNA-binding YbaB/EbfC family protein